MAAKLKIIDAEVKGNVVRFYLGKASLKDWYGDDWDDAPYEHNCGTVYDQFVAQTVDVAFPFDWGVVTIEMDYDNSRYCRDDFKSGIVPLVVAAPKNDAYGFWSFNSVAGAPGAMAFYMGDMAEVLLDDRLASFKVSKRPKVLVFSPLHLSNNSD